MSYQQLQAQLFAIYAAIKTAPRGLELTELQAEGRRISAMLRQFDADVSWSTRGGGNYRPH